MKDTNRKPAPPGTPPDGGRTPYQPQDNPNTAYFDNDPTRIIIRKPAESRLNPICINCVFCGTDCAGTTCQVWTGCIRKPWNPTAQIDLVGATSRHEINPTGLAQAIQVTRTLQPGQRVTLLYNPYDDMILAQIRTAADPISTPSLYDYITTTDKPLTAAEILAHIDNALDSGEELPF